MAKKKRKKQRRPDRPRPAAPAAREEEARAEPSNRQLRKEQARRERDRRIRQARRRRRLGRVAKWTTALVVIGGIGYGIWYLTTRPTTLNDEAQAAMTRLGCEGEGVMEPANETPAGASHLVEGEPPPDYRTDPPTSGKHAPATLPAEPSVYQEPLAGDQLAQAVHNLEHAYVIAWYRPDGPDALDQSVVDALTGYAESQNKVILAPYPDLPEGSSFALTAWTKLVRCPATSSSDDVLAITEGFVEEYRGSGDAPEPQGA